jgi:riboflavin synthase
MPYFVPKGSVCIDGVSLTLAEVDVPAGLIGVALIPETLAKTTLGDLKPGHSVNIEADVMVKTVVHTLRHFLSHTPDALAGIPGAGARAR